MLKRVMVDDKLVAEAVKVGGHKSNREAATVALREYILLKRRMDAPKQPRRDARM